MLSKSDLSPSDFDELLNVNTPIPEFCCRPKPTFVDGPNTLRARLRYTKSTVVVSPPLAEPDSDSPDDSTIDSDDAAARNDYSLSLPYECLPCVFQSLSAGDKKRASVVCRRWLTVEGQSRHRISLNARADLADSIPCLFSRFDSVTKLVLKCDCKSVSIGDD